MIRYLENLPRGKMVLWCYLIWWVVTVCFHFDPSWRIWMNSAGISVVIGFALMLSVSQGPMRAVDRWQTFRLFAMPFCVSSFSSLIKGKGFILILPPSGLELACALLACAAFLLLVWAVKNHQAEPGREPVQTN